MAVVYLKQKEAKTLQFTFTDSDGNAVDLSDSSVDYNFYLKQRKSDAAYTLEKTASDFGAGQAASGILTLALSSSDLDLDPGGYIGEVVVDISASNISKSHDIKIAIVESVSD